MDKIRTSKSMTDLVRRFLHTDIVDYRDDKELIGRIRKESYRCHLVLSTLETFDGESIYYLHKSSASGPKVLVASGFHGEENAGPWAIVRFLETIPDDFISRLDITFLPLMNPTGFRNGTRKNAWGETTNGGFLPVDKDIPYPSREGRILLKYADLLKYKSKNAFVTLHENKIYEEIRDKYCYVYRNEKENKPSKFATTLLNALGKHFEIVPNDMFVRGVGIIKDGFVANESDGTFEDYLFHNGVERTICTETPAMQPIEKRIDALVDVLRSTVMFFNK